jgi:hypothetical protein
MYISRPIHERDLKRSIEGTLHTLLCGESGSGKTWLYKRVAHEEGWMLFCVNSGNAVREKSITKAIASRLLQDGERTMVGVDEEISGKASVAVFATNAASRKKYHINTKELLLQAFSSVRERNPDKVIVLVLDNLEVIFNKPDLMDELGSILLLLDDDDYAKHRIRILLVGVSAHLVDYYQKVSNLETIANRIRELPSVTSLSRPQIEEFVRRGFVAQLKVRLAPFEVKDIAEHVYFATLGIALRLHEYCEHLAFRIADAGGRYDGKLIPLTGEKYMNACLHKAYAVIDGCMNERHTKAGRRNQVLFALGKIEQPQFDASLVEVVVRREFPTSTQGVKLAIGQMLAELSAGDRPLLRKNTRGIEYRFADPRFLMCLRLMLVKSEAGDRVTKLLLRR